MPALQDRFHADFVGMHAAGLVEAHSLRVAAPHVQGYMIAALLFRETLNVLIELRADMLSARILVNTDIVHIQCPDIRKHMRALILLENAERVSGYIRTVSIVGFKDEYRPRVIGKDLPELLCCILGRRSFEEVRPAVVMYHIHLHKEPQYIIDIAGTGSPDPALCNH